MKFKFECPVCHATLVHKRIEDGFESHRISRNGRVTCIGSKSNGGDEVNCSKNAQHIIPTEMIREVIDLVSMEG